MCCILYEVWLVGVDLVGLWFMVVEELMDCGLVMDELVSINDECLGFVIC